jgi:phage tail sheath protein FI
MPVLTTGASKVIINEIDLSQIVTGTSSSTAAQVIVSTQGSLTPLNWTNGQDYLGEYGNPNAAISFDVYCGLDYFTQGTNLWGVRVAGSGYTYAAAIMTELSGVTSMTGVTAGVTDPVNVNWTSANPNPGATPIALFYPSQGPGGYPNVAVGISSASVLAPTTVTLSSASIGGTLPAGTYQYQIASITPTGPSLPTTVQQIVIASGGTSTNEVELTWTNVSSALGYRIYGRTSGDTYGWIADVGQGTYSYVDTGAIVPETTIVPVTTAPANTEFVVQVFNMNVSSSVPAEQFTCTLTDGIDADGIETELMQRINPFSQYIQVTSNVPNLTGALPNITTAAAASLVGGNSGAAPTSFQVAGAWATFDNKELYSVQLLINSGHSDPGTQQAMDALAQLRGDAVGLLDVPSASQTAQAAINYRNLSLNLNSTYSALFSPDVLENDTINGKQQYVPFSGQASALCAYTDKVANPSYSIAGLNRGIINVLGLRVDYDSGDQDNLFNAQVNYARNFTGLGIALWEQQTLQAQSSALSWLSVRRIVNVIKTSLYQYGLYVLQQPGDQFTMRQIVGSYSNYLQTLQNARALSGFTVVCDSSNNPPAQLSAGVLNVTVILIPIIPVHQLVVSLVISKQGISFTETLQSLGISTQ